VITPYPLSLYLRILLISLVIALFGLAPYPHTAGKHLIDANQSIARGDWLVASQNLAEAAKYYPWWLELNLEAGRFAFQGVDPGAAIQYLERLGTISHLSLDDLILLGDAYDQTNDNFMAESIWKRVTELDDSELAYERLANLYLQRKDYASSVTYLQKLLFLNPSKIQMYYQVGSLYAAIDPIKALPFLIQAAQLDPASASKAQALHDKIHTASLMDEPAYTFLISGRQLAQAEQWELAAEAFRQATVIQPGYAEAWAFLGESRQQIAIQETGAVSNGGLSELERALQLDASSSLANTFMALYWERQEEFSQAQGYMQHAIRSSPGDPFLYTELGNILAKAGDLPAAQSAYLSAIQLTPQDPLFYRLLAEFALQYQIQIRELALPAARQAITLAPHDPGSLDVMAQVMLTLQDYRSAERFALSAVQADPAFAPACLHLGISYLYLSEPDLARKWLSLAETVDPGSITASQAERMLAYYFP
jgi:tetratricopeptide (TPR) repeat protein